MCLYVFHSCSFLKQVNTEVIAGEGMIVTAGGVDCHVHFICPQLAYAAISSGEISTCLAVSN